MAIRFYMDGSEWQRDALGPDVAERHWYVFRQSSLDLGQPHDVVSFATSKNNLLAAIAHSEEPSNDIFEKIGDVWISTSDREPPGGWPR